MTSQFIIPSNGFAVMDTETTGLKPGPDRIIEVAVVLMDAFGNVTDHWDTLINPRRHVAGTSIHGITDKDVADAPYFEEIAPYMNSLLENRVLVAHNAPFDARFLAMEQTNVGVSIGKENFLCTLAMSRFLFPKNTNHKLESMTKQFGIKLEDAHAAIADTVACAELFAALCKQGTDFTAPKTAVPFTLKNPKVNVTPTGFSRLADFECNHCPLDEALMPW
jgi:DNA polymerase-3 subunit epsilon